MIRSSSSVRSVLRPPQSATAPQLGPTMLGAQLRRGVEIYLNAERLFDPRDDRSAVLVEAIASDPLAHRLGLSGRENGLAGVALQHQVGGMAIAQTQDVAHHRHHGQRGGEVGSPIEPGFNRRSLQVGE